jgi:hypothetical protein
MLASYCKGLGSIPADYVRFIVDKVTLEQVSLQVSSVFIC